MKSTTERILKHIEFMVKMYEEKQEDNKKSKFEFMKDINNAEVTTIKLVHESIKRIVESS